MDGRVIVASVLGGVVLTGVVIEVSIESSTRSHGSTKDSIFVKGGSIASEVEVIIISNVGVN